MARSTDTAVRVVLVTLGTLRMTRFVTADALGEWMIVGPLKRWAWKETHPTLRPMAATMITADPVPSPDPSTGWRSKMVKGLDCPFCAGFWVGVLILLGEVTVGRSPLRPIWRFGLAALGLNYIVGHMSSRID